MKIPLKIEIVEKMVGNLHLPFTQIRGITFFKGKGNRNFRLEGIFDTGASYCVFPPRFWKRIDPQFLQIHGRTHFSGFNLNKECRISCQLARVGFSVGNNDCFFKPFSCFAFLVDSDKMPIVLGINECLDRFSIEICLSEKRVVMKDIPKSL